MEKGTIRTRSYICLILDLQAGFTRLEKTVSPKFFVEPQSREREILRVVEVNVKTKEYFRTRITAIVIVFRDFRMKGQVIVFSQ